VTTNTRVACSSVAQLEQDMAADGALADGSDTDRVMHRDAMAQR